MANLEGLASKV